ncbi:MAG: zf-HC2 domain-containing protein, partial [Bryobacterales bacterium]|nr:zf-HC2 domain-containing protein [Bryobacterales bacterium]
MTDSHHSTPGASGKHRGAHPSSQDLMAMQDGELAAPGVWRVRRHVEGCADCQRLLRRYAIARESIAGDVLVNALGGLPAVDAAVLPVAEPVTIKRNDGIAFPWRGTVAASISLALGIFLLWQLLLAPPGVNAREIIAQARLEEEGPRRVAPGQAVERELRATRRGRGRDTATAARRKRWSLLPGGHLAEMADAGTVDLETTGAGATFGVLADELARALPAETCAPLDPLSARMMDCLARHGSAEVVSAPRPGDDHAPVYELLIWNRNPRRGEALCSRWTLQTTGWRVIRAVYEFPERDGGLEYRFEEVAYHVVKDTEVAKRRPAAEPTPAPRVSAGLDGGLAGWAVHRPPNPAKGLEKSRQARPFRMADRSEWCTPSWSASAKLVWSLSRTIWTCSGVSFASVRRLVAAMRA